MTLPVSRAALLALSLLSACAASDFGWDDAPGRSNFTPTGAYGDYLSGRFAAQRSDLQVAATKLEDAARLSGVRDVESQAFIAAVMAGRPEAARLARGLPDNPVAQLVLADDDAKAGRWDAAEARFAGMSQQGVTQILRPLLMAWAEAGAGHTDAALATLQPLVEAGRVRGVMALHSAMIADLGGHTDEAARLYRTAQADYGSLNLRLGIILASWQARNGNLPEAQRIIREMVAGSGDLAMARLALEARVTDRPVASATDGIAEAYLAMAASLQQQPAGRDTAQLLLQLALSLRPDFASARLLLADSEITARRGRAALETLEGVASSDPLIPVVRLRQAAIEDSLGETDQAAARLEALARQFPDRPEPLAEAGQLLRRKNRFAEAVGMYDRAIARLGTPSRANWGLFYERGIAHERAGQWPEAESDFRYALKLSPDQPSVLNYLGYSLAERGIQLSEARDMIQNALDQRPDDGAIVDSLGWVLLRLGDTKGALANLERGVELQPEDPVVNGHLGDALAAVGRWREAEFQWRRALTLKPDADEEKRVNSRLAAMPVAAAVPAQGQVAPTTK